jgi:putative ABC transport system permease protein
MAGSGNRPGNKRKSGGAGMINLLKISIRNLRRYRRRTILTSSLVTIGVVFVLLFASIAGSFKTMMISQITDSMLGHLQVHLKGYLASIDNLPLNLNLDRRAYEELSSALGSHPEVEAFSPRIKFGGILSNFSETTNVRLNGIYPEHELETVPLLASRIMNGRKTLNRGEILVPDLLARGMGVHVGDTVVIVATNRDGSVNGKQLQVSGILESVTGPGGRDGYVLIQDAMEILRMEEMEISEVAIRIKDFDRLHAVTQTLQGLLSSRQGKGGKPLFEVHNWEKLSPFYNIAKMIDLMSFFIKAMLIAVVLISIMNVMLMAVYERIREIGTIAAMGTAPGKILAMFLLEGFCLGTMGAVAGSLLAALFIQVLNRFEIAFNFGRQTFVLASSITAADVLITSFIVVLVSVMASLQPALKASKMEPITALRHV